PTHSPTDAGPPEHPTDPPAHPPHYPHPRGAPRPNHPHNPQTPGHTPHPRAAVTRGVLALTSTVRRMHGGGEPSRQVVVVRPRVVLRAAALVIAAGVALVAQAASGDWTPWLWGVGALFVVVLLGARQRWGATVTATVALVVADLVWLLAMPWWGWV